MNKAHAKLGASTSEIWLNCPGAPNLWEIAPEKPESRYADEGTKAHDLMEIQAKAFLKKKYNPKNVSPEYPDTMVKAVDVVIDEMKKHVTPKHIVLIEEKISLEHIDEGMFGTADIGLIEHFGTLDMWDFKYGRGIRVKSYYEDTRGRRLLNTQLAYYALGLSRKYQDNFKRARLKIIQPRYQGAPPVHEVIVPMSELLVYEDVFKMGVERTKKKGAKRFAGPWCRFCKAKPICKEGQGGYRTNSRDDFDEV